MEDKKFTQFALEMELSDLIFEHHMKSYMTLNICIISFQFFLLISSMIIDAIWNIRISSYTCWINISLCLVVICNNLIHNITWKKAKFRSKKIIKGIDFLACDKDEELYDKYRIFMKALCPTTHFKEDDKKHKN